MKYYLVRCKFGHVGKNKYLPLNVPVIASSVKEASKKASATGGVKRNHKDWCLEGPIEISYERYLEEKELFDNDIYFEKKTRSRLHLFKDRLVDEPNYTRKNGIKTNVKKYNKSRNPEAVNFKRNKTKAIIESFEEEQKIHETTLEDFILQKAYKNQIQEIELYEFIDLSGLKVVVLKEFAKKRKIAGYSSMRKAELLEALPSKINELKLVELKTLAKMQKIPNFSKMRKQELIESLE